MTNDYLQIDDWIYWFIYPRMLNRQRAEHRQHEVIAERPRDRHRRRLTAMQTRARADRPMYIRNE
jgi:hypothetical protein